MLVYDLIEQRVFNNALKLNYYTCSESSEEHSWELGGEFIKSKRWLTNSGRFVVARWDKINTYIFSTPRSFNVSTYIFYDKKRNTIFFYSKNTVLSTVI